MKTIFKPGKRYTFSDYFSMTAPTVEIVNALGYSLSVAQLNLPVSQHVEAQFIDSLRAAYYDLIPKVPLNSETAKRELLIAPLLQGIVRLVEGTLNIEYWVEVDERLSGAIDYLFQAEQRLVVVEAKKGDLERGFNQLAAEMIALDQYEADHPTPFIYGAISIGEVWRFAQLERPTKQLTRDVHTFRYPEDLELLTARLMGILKVSNQ